MRLALYIEMSGKNVLVIGGSSVGTSRVKKFLSAGANVTVLSLEFIEELKELEAKGKVRLVTGDAADETLLDRHMDKAYIVVVALNSLKLNERIFEVASRCGTLVNLANDADATEVVVPFEAEVNGLRVAMTSEGKSGVVVREALARVVANLSKDKEISVLLELMHHLKLHMKDNGVPVQERMRAYFRVFDDKEFRELAKVGDIESARSRAEGLVGAG